MLKYPHLFSPITLGNTVFKNRLFASPISGRTLDRDNCPTTEGISFYARKAEGGAASVCIGDCIVDSQRGLYGADMIRLDQRDNMHSLNRLSEAISRRGSVASVELQHAGVYSNVAHGQGQKVFGPSDGQLRDGREYFEMPEEMIYEIIEKFAGSAAWAKACGFGMVTIHGGHGWLLSQFLSPHVNHRHDKWGGSPENRARIVVEIAKAIKKSCGQGFPVEIRISGSEVSPHGYDLDEGIAIAKAIDGHVDLIHVSAGHHEFPEVFCVTHPSIFAADSENIIYASEIKKHVKTPVATVGAHGNPELLEEIIASGQADVIQMARALLADPDLPKKARRGETEKIRPCLRCLQCFSGLITNGQIYCAVNPEIGNEVEYKTLPKAAKPKKVSIIGGGMGGMQAAITLGNRGHDVTLIEEKSDLGGALLCETKVPFKSKIHDYIEYQKRQLENLPVDIRKNTRATKELLTHLSPDVIIASTGAVPSLPPISGIEGDNVFFAEEIYENPDKAKGDIIVLGGGLVGTEMAIYLGMLGKKVTIIEMAPALNSGGNILHQFALDVEIEKQNITVHTDTRAAQVSDNGVLCDQKGSELFIEGDTVVCATGQAPRRDEAFSFGDLAAEFHVIGDCLKPKNIQAATSQAEAVARMI